MYPYPPQMNFGMNPMNPSQQNILPPQQILQANGKASIDALRMSPNSSALIADSTQPVIWKCISDSLGNVSATAFDVFPHKDEATVQKESVSRSIESITERLDRLEKNYESITNRNTKPTTTTVQTPSQQYARGSKPESVSSADGKF